jgi:hypothetical protein
MPIDLVLQPLFDTTATIAKRSSSHTDGYTDPGYDTPTTYYAHIERSEETVRREDGREFVSRRKVFLYCSTGWTATNMPRTSDQLTLPATHPPTTPQIMMITPVSDEYGIHHIVIYC